MEKNWAHTYHWDHPIYVSVHKWFSNTAMNPVEEGLQCERAEFDRKINDCSSPMCLSDPEIIKADIGEGEMDLWNTERDRVQLTEEGGSCVRESYLKVTYVLCRETSRRSFSPMNHAEKWPRGGQIIQLHWNEGPCADCKGAVSTFVSVSFFGRSELSDLRGDGVQLLRF